MVEYMFPGLQGLPEEFRRLADEEPETSDHWQNPAYYSGLSDGWTLAMDRAARMLEDKLNG